MDALAATSVITAGRRCGQVGKPLTNALRRLRGGSRCTNLGVESAREEVGITVSYWRDLESVAAWKRVVDHVAALRLGRERWYATYRVRIARVEREYGFNASRTEGKQVKA